MSTPAQMASSTARSYALVGFVFYLLAAIGWGIALLAFLATSPFWIGTMPMWPGFLFPVIFPFGTFGALAVGFAWWSWSTLKQIEQSRFVDARTASLVLGVFGIFLAFVVGGIFFLLAYGKLGEALQPPFMGYPAPSPVLRFCTHCGRATTLEAKFCAFCGKQLPA